MQALIQMIISFVAMLAAAALSQFGLQLDSPQKPQREIHRVRDCGDKPVTQVIASVTEQRRDC